MRNKGIVRAAHPRPRTSGGLHLPHPGNTPIVDHTQFTDAHPTLGSPSATFNPSGANQAGPAPNGPMKYPPGEPRVQKNVQRSLSNSNAPY